MLALVLSTLLLTVTASCFAVNDSYYIAAVYEYAADANQPTEEVVSRKGVLAVMHSNLDILETQAVIAKSQDVDIFVFPEYGISGLQLLGLLNTDAYVEAIPDVVSNSSYCPCSKDYMQRGEEVLHRLSCIASNNSMYIAANMGDKVRCSRQHDSQCPLFGHYHYNTEVVFDRRGCLVAKYHKQHLFQEERLLWNEPKEVEHVYFDTDFGRFGLVICFDVVYRSPAVELVERYNVTDIIFSTAWMNVYPYYVSIAYHSGWARTMRVNYLTSNIHDVSGQYIGSGVYSPHGVIDYTFNKTSDAFGFLVVAQVPIKNGSRLSDHSNAQFKYGPTPTNHSEAFFSHIFGDSYKLIPLRGNAENLTVCDGEVCCHLQYTRADDSQLYALGVFNGMHYVQGKYYLEVCLLTRCSKDGKVCGTLPEDSMQLFLSYNLTGVMNTEYAFPEVISADDFTSDWEFIDNDYTKTIVGENKNFSSVVLMGRNFDKDKETLQVVVSCVSAGASVAPHKPYMLFVVGLAITRWW